MVNYFKGFYELGIAYSPNYYGTMPYAPPATVLLYDDNQGFCIGYMASELPEGVQGMTEAEAQAEVAQAQDIDGVWFGEKLAHRWDAPITESDGSCIHDWANGDIEIIDKWESKYYQVPQICRICKEQIAIIVGEVNADTEQRLSKYPKSPDYDELVASAVV